MTDQNFYTAFTDRHRGSRELVKSRLETDYSRFLKPLGQLYPDGKALDLGCGRGEWLELLEERGFETLGIDLDEGMLTACRERGFTVEKQDAVGAFAALADESQAIVSAFHLVEHIPFEGLQTLVNEAMRVLKPGGLMILETPNPENILVSTSGFYLDPTHQRPIPLHLLAFLAEYCGFARIKVLRLHESPEMISKPVCTLLDVLGGASPDYAIIAQKTGSEDQMAITGPLFTPEKGLMLDTLTLRYDQQAEARVAQAEARLAQRLAQNEAHIAQNEARLEQNEARIAQNEARATRAEMELHALYTSRSWRLTKPLRYFAEVARRMRNGARGLARNTRRRSGSAVEPRLSGATRSIPGNHVKQLFIDVSAIVQEDAKTGIQRVTRSILKEYLDNPPDGYKVEPVYATPYHAGYRYARQYAAQLQNQECAEQDEYISYHPGDLFLGLDLQHRTLLAQHGYLMGLRQDGVKIFFVVYDLLPILMPHAFALETDIHKMWLEVITDFDGAVCISRAVADELIEWLDANGQQRLHPYKINWFHLGADIENSVPTPGLPAGAEGVLDRIAGAPTFLMVGTVEPRKGQQQTLDAFERLWARGLDLNLVIVGRPGWKVEALIERLRHHPELGKRLFWLKGISDEYLEKVYAASVCLLAASEGEGFGLPLIEAARHKLPIIARGIPVFREVAGEHAFYFDGLSPDQLASAVEEWLALAAAGGAPQSSGIQWLTWVESAEQLKRGILGNDAYKQWLPQRKNI